MQDLDLDWVGAYTNARSGNGQEGGERHDERDANNYTNLEFHEESD